MAEGTAQQLIARLMAHRWLPRHDSDVKRLIVDELFRDDVLRRLDECGLKLLENPFAEHVAIGLKEEMEQSVMSRDTGYLSNTFKLDQDAVALLVILWGLLVIPKRQRQMEAANEERTDEQMDFFPSPRLVSTEQVDRPTVKKEALISDFGLKLGKKTRMERNLGQLTRLGFIIQSNRTITEGPLLDLVFDYRVMASRIIEGALSDVLTDQEQQQGQEDDDVTEGDHV